MKLATQNTPLKNSKTIKGALATVAVFGLLTACGGDDDDSAPRVVYSNLEVSEATKADPSEAGTDDKKYELTQATCTRDAETGLFQSNFSAGEGGPSLAIKLKNFKTSGETKTCTQATDNVEGSVGGKYEGCSVAVQVYKDGLTSNKLNKYAMHRAEETLDKLDYNGECSVNYIYSEPKVTGTVQCADLIQTEFAGAPRNPINSAVTIDVVSTTFECNI